MEKIERFGMPFMEDDTITVRLNHFSKFFVKSQILAEASDYFSEALDNRNSKDVQNRILRIENCEEDVFMAFIYWVHHKSIPNSCGQITRTQDYSTEDCLSTHSHDYQELLIRLWVFADTCRMKGLKEAAVDSLLDILAAWGTTFDMVRYAYDYAPEGCVIRKIFAKQGVYDRFRQAGLDPMGREQAECFQEHPEFVADLLYVIRDYRGEWTTSQTKWMREFRPKTWRFLMGEEASEDDIERAI